jgi:hypothetical protein
LDDENAVFKKLHLAEIGGRVRPRNRHRQAAARCDRGRRSRHPIPRQTTAAGSGVWAWCKFLLALLLTNSPELPNIANTRRHNHSEEVPILPTFLH